MVDLVELAGKKLLNHQKRLMLFLGILCNFVQPSKTHGHVCPSPTTMGKRSPCRGRECRNYSSGIETMAGTGSASGGMGCRGTSRPTRAPGGGRGLWRGASRDTGQLTDLQVSRWPVHHSPTLWLVPALTGKLWTFVGVGVNTIVWSYVTNMKHAVLVV